MRNLIRFFSFNSFVWAALGVGALLALRLARDGFSWLDVALLAVYAAGCIVLNRRLRTPNAKAAAFDALAAFHRVLHQGRPTLIEFYQQSA